VRWVAALAVTLAAAAAATGAGVRSIVGRSVEGRAIRAVDVGAADAKRRLLVVGSIHGDEPAGTLIARRLLEHAPPANADLWVVADLNPDGAAADTRQNAHGVDLNRNFPWRWRRLGRRGDRYYSGPRPLSEPESRFAYSLIRRLRPHITIWFHQPYGVVDESGGNVSIERMFARLTGLPLRRLPRYPGSAAEWQDHSLRRTTAFVVELPPGRISTATAGRYAEAVLDLTGEGPTT
jgi:murein peptide amidase A